MRKKSDEDGWQGFLALCAKARSSEEVKRLFELFLTLEEKEVLGRRYLIVKALESGKLTQREIAEKFKVSISQITRGSNALKIIGADLRKFLKEY
jgi:TrpR family trp operon transcriptional repressor